MVLGTPKAPSLVHDHELSGLSPLGRPFPTLSDSCTQTLDLVGVYFLAVLVYLAETPGSSDSVLPVLLFLRNKVGVGEEGAS